MILDDVYMRPQWWLGPRWADIDRGCGSRSGLTRVPWIVLAGLLLGLPVPALGQARDDAAAADDESESPTQLRRYRLEQQLRRYRLEQQQEEPFIDPLALEAVPSPRSAVLIPPALMPEVFPPKYHQVGDFALSAVTTVGAAYDDNVDADDEHRDEATFLGASASTRAQSLYARHSVGFGASATGTYPLDEDGESDFAWVVGADGQIDLTRRSAIRAAVAYTQGTEDPESPDIDDDDEASDFWHGTASLGYDVEGRRLGWGIGTQVSRTDFEEREPDDRDRTIYTISTNTTYRRSERLSLLSNLSYGLSKFDNDPAGDRSRDSHRGTATVGLVYDFGERLSMGASIGYSQVFFEEDERDDKGSIVGDASISWTLPGRQTSVSLDFDHSVHTTTAEDAAIRTTTSGMVGVTRLLGRATALSGSLGYAHSEFDTDKANQDDIVAQLRLAHAFNRTFSAGIGYRYRQRFSGDEDSEFYRNVVFVGVTANL